MKTKPRLPFSPETVEDLAQQLADYHRQGYRVGSAAAVQLVIKKAAQKHGRSFSELWAIVHEAAHKIMAAESVEPGSAELN